MIIKGSNTPIVLTFDEDMTNVVKLSITLFDKSHNAMKHWLLSDVVISRDMIRLPLSEIETINFRTGKCTLEVKWIKEGIIELSDVVEMEVVARYDTTILGGM